MFNTINRIGFFFFLVRESVNTKVFFLKNMFRSFSIGESQICFKTWHALSLNIVPLRCPETHGNLRLQNLRSAVFFCMSALKVMENFRKVQTS